MTPPDRRPVLPTPLTALALGLLLTACLPHAAHVEPGPNGPAPLDTGTEGKGGGDLDKLGADLITLHDAYLAFLARETADPQAFAATDPALRVTDGRVAVDATASGDPVQLEHDLIALGLVGAARIGAVVSGYLPIEALHAAAALTTLRNLTAVKASVR